MRLQGGCVLCPYSERDGLLLPDQDHTLPIQVMLFLVLVHGERRAETYFSLSPPLPVSLLLPLLIP
jgi:hypothetical protein